MIDPRVLKEVENLAAGLAEPGRSDEVKRYYLALIGELNQTHDANGEQDAFALFEALAMVLAQITANLEPGAREGVFNYVTYRAEFHHKDFREAGSGARIVEEPLPAGRH